MTNRYRDRYRNRSIEITANPNPIAIPKKERMDRSFYTDLAERSLSGDLLEDALCVRILEDARLELLPLLDAAYQVRRVHYGNKVSIHILNNAENGHCPEDCAYCAQGRGSEAAIVDYGMKSEAEILAEAQRAYAAGGHRYCMVFAGGWALGGFSSSVT